MKRCDRILLACLLGFLLSTSGAFAQQQPEYKKGELLIKFRAGISLQATTVSHASLGSHVAKHFRKTGIQLVKLRSGLTTKEAIELYNKDPGVEYAEPNYRLYALAVFPNDPMFGDLWGLHNTGQTGGSTDADIDSPEAWDMNTGSSDVVVGVIDTGVDYHHEDLSANMWVNDAELNGTTDVDDDGNGYVDDIYGIDAYNDDGDPWDDNGHGTHCAGTIGAVGNNAIGVVGINWNVKVMALKFLNSGGSGNTDDAITCLEYAIMMKEYYGQNIRVTNNSWGGGGYSQALYDTIQAAADAEILFVAAAGNNTSDNDTYPHYPSNFDLPSVIAVAATDHNDDLASFSNWGLTSVDVAAPGVDIYSTLPPFAYLTDTCNDNDGNGYDFCSGTSMAAPHVAGLAALVLAQVPFFSSDEVKSTILTTVDPLASLQGLILTAGRINAERALLSACNSSGEVLLDQVVYNAGGVIGIKVLDRDLNTDPMAIEQYSDIITITTTGGDTEDSITLTESEPDSCIFAGTISTEDAEVTPGDAVVQMDCSIQDMVTVTYLDADDGTGQPASPEATAAVDCHLPEISNVGVTGIEFDTATITWDTDEPADSCVYYATSLPADLSKCELPLVAAHEVSLTGLGLDTTYYFAVASTDQAGNETIDDNSGAYYEFHSYVPQTHYVPDDYGTIQEAVDGVSQGDIIVVRPGTYYENINFGDKAVTIRNDGGAEPTTINGGGAGSVVTFGSLAGHEAVLKGLIITNGSASNGGGIYCSEDASPTITNCIIANNWAAQCGGGIYCGSNSSPTIANCTISSNTAAGYGGGIYCNNALPTVINSILWGDTVGESPNEVYLDGSSSASITYCNIEGGWTGAGNIDCAPEFLGFQDYHLLPSSCCIDQGTSSGAPDEDLDGDARPQASGYDIGADEYVERTGLIASDREACRPDTDISIVVMDIDLNTDPGMQEHYSEIITITTTGGDEESSITMTETGSDTGVFTGSMTIIDTGIATNDGTLQIACSISDIVTATYHDAADASGQPATSSDTAVADCFWPVVTNVEAIGVEVYHATITWDTDELADSRVHYGPTVPPQSSEWGSSSLMTAHSVPLTGLSPYTTYYFAVESTDQAGNQIVDDNNGEYYVFETVAPASKWARTYGGDHLDEAFFVQQTSDGGYAVTGSTYSFGTSRRDVWALKVNADGTVAWDKAYGESYEDVGCSIQQASDGGFIVAGYTASFGSSLQDIWVLKLNHDGTIAWQKIYGEEDRSELAYSIQQTSDGGYIVAGGSYGDPFGPDPVDALLLKLNSDGTVEWQKTYGGGRWDAAESIQQTSDGGYVVAGYSDSFSAGEFLWDYWLLKLSSDGTVEWQKTYDEGANDQAYSVQQTSDGGYVVAGGSNGTDGDWDAWVLKLNSDGTITWQKTYGGNQNDDAVSIHQTSDGGYLMGGYTRSFGAGDWDYWLLKLNSDGALIWGKTYGGTDGDIARCMQPTSDGGCVVAGLSYSFVSEWADFWVLKLDKNGEIDDCSVIGTSDAIVSDTSVEVQDSSGTVQDFSGIIYDTSVSPQDTSAETSVVCFGEEAFYNISGRITDNGSGFNGVSVQLTGLMSNSTITSGGGYYSFLVFENGSYTITPSLAGYQFNPSSRQITVSGGDMPGQDFATVDPSLIIADFSGDPLGGDKPLTVQFTDQSIGAIDTWEWDFDNDGTVDSYDQSPAPWTYTEARDYTVFLTVTGPGGSDTETKTDYIHVTEPSGPIIDKIRGVKEPGKIIRIIGSGFGDPPQVDSEVHIGPKVFHPAHKKIKLWTDTKIKVKLPNYKCEWFKGNDYKRRKIWVMVGGQDGVSSNVKKIKVFKPDTCP